MKEYLYTNDELSFILKLEGSGQINWEENGMSVKEVSRHQAQGTKNDKMESIIPISDKLKFNKVLGNLIALGTDGDYFYRVIPESEAAVIKEELKALQEAIVQEPTPEERTAAAVEFLAMNSMPEEI